MKRFLCLLIVLLMGVGMCACEHQTSSVEPIPNLSDKTCEDSAISALKEVLAEKYEHIWTYIDISKSHFEVKSITSSPGGGSYRVSGTYELCDSLGLPIMGNKFVVNILRDLRNGLLFIEVVDC